MTQPTKTVFVSYASQDTEAARHFCDALRAAGIEVWFDQSELRGGDTWDRQIRRQIHDCTLFIPIISEHTQLRLEGYFRREWKLAADRTHDMAAEKAFLIPVVIDDTSERHASVPDKFHEVQWTRLPAGEATPAFVEQISRLLAPEPAHAPGETESPVPTQRTAAEPRQSHPGPPVSRRTQRAVLLVAAVAIIGVGYFAGGKFVRSKRTVGSTQTYASTGQTSTSGLASIPEESIAVLPFVDLSEKKDQEYFSEGLSEELIDLLSKIPELRVPARTSSFSFKGTSKKVGEIGRELKVTHILEGSVRKAGSRVRITAQLIRTDTGYHLWSDTYDRDLKDIFKVQDDIAHAVVGQLQLKILGPVPSASAATANTEAHDLYLQARYFTDRETEEDLSKAISRYQRSLELDPTYSAAWAWLSFTYVRQQVNKAGVVGAGFAKARAAAQRAVELGPKLADGFAALAQVQLYYDFDWAATAESLARAQRIDPNNTMAAALAGQLSQATAGPAEAIASFRRSVELDPLNLLAQKYLGRALYSAGRYDEAEATLRQLIDLNPEFQGAHYELGRVLIARGQPAPALSSFEAEKSAWRDLGLPLGYRAAGRNSQADAALATLVKNPAGREFQIAEAYGFFGNADRALEWLEKARQTHDAGLCWLRGDPLLSTVRGDPRYKAFLRKNNLSQ